MKWTKKQTKNWINLQTTQIKKIKKSDILHNTKKQQKQWNIYQQWGHCQ